MSKSYSPPQVCNEEKKREELVRRMIRAYNKNKNAKKDGPEKSKPTQSELRKRKLEDLNSRADSWKGLK